MTAAVATDPGVRVAGDTNVGKVRTSNEDSLVVDHALGLYAVFDGMGGANAGDVASQMARDAVRAMVGVQRQTTPPGPLLEAAILHACAVVHGAAQASRERHGMGTTVVASLLVNPHRIIVAHVGDSRAYLLRNGRLQQLTKDHTIVEELVEKGLLSAADAENHAYKNVLSRNLGAMPTTRVDVLDLELKAGDRLLLCSDGLYGYAAAEAIQYVLGSGDAPADVARDLIELALRGGGGDNVSTIIIEPPPAAPSSTQVVRTHGAIAWWQRRQRFVAVAKDRGLTSSPICRGLSPEEALDVIALSLCQAVFHDLEKSTGVNVWTFAQNLASGWFERGGEWAPLRALIDILAMSARVVVDEIRAADPALGFLLDIAVSRALVVAELALGGLLSERLRQIDDDLVHAHAAAQETIAEPESLDAELEDSQEHATGERPRSDAREVAADAPDLSDTGPRPFTDHPTIPFLRADRALASVLGDELVAAIGSALTIARGRVPQRAELVKQVIAALEMIATDGDRSNAAILAARDLYGVRPVDDIGIMPLFDALDQARILTAASVHQIQGSEPLRARVLRSVSAAHQRLVSAMTGLVIDAVAPYSARLAEAQAATTALRTEVAKTERRRADLEKRFATVADASLPWGSRGTTEW